MRGSRGVLSALMVGTVLLGVCALSVADRPALTEQEQRWLDRRLDDQERAVLDATIGYAPLEFDDDAEWFGTEALSLDSLRGKVVVLQTWTRKTSRGRSAPRHVASVLGKFSADDVRVIAIHTPEGAEGVASYFEKKAPPLPTIVDESGEICDELGVYKRPVAIVIDRQGAVRYTGVSLTGLPLAVESLLDERFDSKAARPSIIPSRDDRDDQMGIQVSAVRPGTGDFPPITGALSGANDLRGKRGPTIAVKDWLTGEPQTDGKVVMVEFWATWCGPCIQGIPHLNDLQAAFPEELVVMGITAESASKAQSTVRSKNMRYTVASDPSRRMTYRVKNKGIPHALVMSPDGIVRWQGHPASLSKDTLGRIIEASDIGGAGSGGGSVSRWVLASE